jgi:hypothetical protein
MTIGGEFKERLDWQAGDAVWEAPDETPAPVPTIDQIQASLEHGSKGHSKARGDDDAAGGHEEENTFGLPEGEDIAARLRVWLRRQAREILGILPDIGDHLPPEIPDLGHYDEPMTKSVTPLISAYWDSGAKEIRAKLGLEPDAWRHSWSVVDPSVRQKIKDSSLAFCRSTNASTSMRLGDALTALREELEAGVVDEGESVAQLSKRVRGIFDGLTKTHARMIGQTEASRAVHSGQEASVEESGVVQGAEWLLSSNACSRCQRIKEEVGRVKLGQNFAVIGSNPYYADIRMPPGHPRCRCSILWITTPEYGGPEDVNWGKTLIHPTDESKDDEDAAT